MRKKMIIVILLLVLLLSVSACSRFSGTWYDINNIDDIYYLDFTSRNTVVFGTTNNVQGIAVPYSIEGDSLFITIPSTQITYRFILDKTDGITHIKGSLSGQAEFDFVPADYYESLKPNQQPSDITPSSPPGTVTPPDDPDIMPTEDPAADPALDETPAAEPETPSEEPSAEPGSDEPEASVPIPDEDGWYYDVENVTAYLMAYGITSRSVTLRTSAGPAVPLSASGKAPPSAADALAIMRGCCRKVVIPNATSIPTELRPAAPSVSCFPRTAGIFTRTTTMRPLRRSPSLTEGWC